MWLLVAGTALLVFKFGYVDSATTWLRCVSTATNVCGAQATTDIPFPGGPRLRGYDVGTQTLHPGGTLRVNLFWQGEAGSGEGLYTFVHVRNSRKEWPVNPRTGSDIWAQDDHFTPGGLLTRDFLPGKLYRDEFRVALPTDLPPGEYFLEVGLLNPVNSEQLDPQADTVKPPLEVLWRSVLLPSITVK